MLLQSPVNYREVRLTPETEVRFCSECGRQVSQEDVVRFGDRQVCPHCKDAYAQKLREGVAPAGFVRYGGFWLRFVAMLLDGIIVAVPMWILQAVVFASMMPSFRQLSQNPNPRPDEIMGILGPMFGMIGLSALVGMVIACTYETFFLVRYAATPGKMALGLKVVRPGGSKIDAGRAIGRYFSKLLSAIILYIGYIMAGFDSQKRALHDIICDTRVVKTRG
jgi:uncharacterized RDD family membrane protein YckC